MTTKAQRRAEILGTTGPCWVPGCRGKVIYPPDSINPQPVTCNSEWDPHTATIRALESTS